MSVKSSRIYEIYTQNHLIDDFTALGFRIEPIKSEQQGNVVKEFDLEQLGRGTKINLRRILSDFYMKAHDIKCNKREMIDVNKNAEIRADKLEELCGIEIDKESILKNTIFYGKPQYLCEVDACFILNETATAESITNKEAMHFKLDSKEKINGNNSSMNKFVWAIPSGCNDFAESFMKAFDKKEKRLKKPLFLRHIDDNDNDNENDEKKDFKSWVLFEATCLSAKTLKNRQETESGMHAILEFARNLLLFLLIN